MKRPSSTGYELTRFIPELVPFDSWAGKRWLEVGCGQGAESLGIRGAGAHVYGVDLK